MLKGGSSLVKLLPTSLDRRTKSVEQHSRGILDSGLKDICRRIPGCNCLLLNGFIVSDRAVKHGRMVRSKGGIHERLKTGDRFGGTSASRNRTSAKRCLIF